MIGWYGLLAPAGISRDIRTRLHADAVRAMGNADMKTKMQAIGFEVVGDTPEQFAEHIHSESARWAKLIRVTGIRAN
jgi:tripartite-type tricarboxylate transporter receptor subunit TctC